MGDVANDVANEVANEVTDEVAEDLAEQETKKEDEVLEREGYEQELMQKDASHVGEDLDDVQDGGGRE